MQKFYPGMSTNVLNEKSMNKLKLVMFYIACEILSQQAPLHENGTDHVLINCLSHNIYCG